MKKISGAVKSLTALLLCLVMLVSAPAAFAEEESSGENISIIDPDELQKMMDDYVAEHNLCADNISIGYCYTATGDRWIYNGGRWYYSASMYKVPLFMIYAQKVYEGELTQDSDINGMSLADLETRVLVYSNNDFAHHAMNYLAGTPGQTHDGDRRVREMYQQFSDMPREDYIEDFYDYSYFTPEFMTDVMEELFYNSEHYPNIIESLKLAQPDSYFNRYLAGQYEVAQKYGAFKEFNNTTGIIYTPNPFILTVMTEHMGVNDGIIADCARMFKDYTLSLDEKLAAFNREKEEAEKAKQEEEQRAQEEAQRLEAERKAEEQRRAEEEARIAEEQRLEQEKAEKKDKIIKISCAAAGIAVGILLIALGIKKALSSGGRKKQKVRNEDTPYAGAPRRAEPRRENRGAEPHSSRRAPQKKDHYRPKH